MITESIDTRNAMSDIQPGSIVQYVQESYVDEDKLEKAVEQPVLAYLGQYARVLKVTSGHNPYDTAKVAFADGHENYILLSDLLPGTQADFDAEVLMTLSKQALAILLQAKTLSDTYGEPVVLAVNESFNLMVKLQRAAEHLHAQGKDAE